MSYWSWNNGSTNGLKGVDGTMGELLHCANLWYEQPNPNNPAVLQGIQILYALSHSPVARQDFLRVFPTLLPEEQERLTRLIEDNYLSSLLIVDSQTRDDNFQSVMVDTPVRCVGPRGGGNIGRNTPNPGRGGRRR